VTGADLEAIEGDGRVERVRLAGGRTIDCAAVLVGVGVTPRASLAEALQGEVDPKSLEVSVSGDEAMLTIVISYTLAVVGHRESQLFTLGAK